MATAATPELRRKVARLSQHEAATATTTTLVLVKRLVAAVDALPRATQLAHAHTLTRDWGRLFYGCKADQNRGRFSIYRRTRAELLILHDELDALVNP